MPALPTTAIWPDANATHANVGAAPFSAASPAALRRLLVIGLAVSVASALWLAEPSAYLQSDPQLAFLLRGMAALKALMVAAAAGVLWWRLGHPIGPGLAAVYLVGCCSMAAASVLVWQLSLIPLAALAFHLGGFAVLLAAWSDRQGDLKRRAAV